MADRKVDGPENDSVEQETMRSGGTAVSFVMTLWLEPSAEPEWRWRVTHVQSGHQRYFRRLEDVLAYVSAEAGVAPPK